MAEKLRCVLGYRNDAQGLVYEAGQVFEAEPQLRMFLMSDAPGCFEVVREPRARTRRKAAKPRNKAILDAVEEKRGNCEL